MPSPSTTCTRTTQQPTKQILNTNANLITNLFPSPKNGQTGLGRTYSSSLCTTLAVPCREALGLPFSLSLMPDLGGCGVPTLDMGLVEAPSAVEEASSKSCHSGKLAVSSRSLETRASCNIWLALTQMGVRKFRQDNIPQSRSRRCKARCRPRCIACSSRTTSRRLA